MGNEIMSCSVQSPMTPYCAVPPSELICRNPSKGAARPKQSLTRNDVPPPSFLATGARSNLKLFGNKPSWGIPPTGASGVCRTTQQLLSAGIFSTRILPGKTKLAGEVIIALGAASLALGACGETSAADLNSYFEVADFNCASYQDRGELALSYPDGANPRDIEFYLKEKYPSMANVVKNLNNEGQRIYGYDRVSTGPLYVLTYNQSTNVVGILRYPDPDNPVADKNVQFTLLDSSVILGRSDTDNLKHPFWIVRWDKQSTDPQKTIINFVLWSEKDGKKVAEQLIALDGDLHRTCAGIIEDPTGHLNRIEQSCTETQLLAYFYTSEASLCTEQLNRLRQQRAGQ